MGLELPRGSLTPTRTREGGLDSPRGESTPSGTGGRAWTPLEGVDLRLGRPGGAEPLEGETVPSWDSLLLPERVSSLRLRPGSLRTP